MVGPERYNVKEHSTVPPPLACCRLTLHLEFNDSASPLRVPPNFRTPRNAPLALSDLDRGLIDACLSGDQIAWKNFCDRWSHPRRSKRLDFQPKHSSRIARRRLFSLTEKQPISAPARLSPKKFTRKLFSRRRSTSYPARTRQPTTIELTWLANPPIPSPRR